MLKISLFRPILAGATLKERLIGCAGALIGILVTGLFCGYVFGNHPDLPLIVAPIGASAVLLFAVPASPLAQPWPIIGGNTISALVGVIVAHVVKDPMIATGVAVGLAIAAMSLTRSLHPPGGAAALTAVIGGPAVSAAGFWFPLVPVGINSVILVALGLAFHRLANRSYPHKPIKVANPHQTTDTPPILRIGFDNSDIDAALTDFNEALDISRDDLGRLLRQVELHALGRSHTDLRCREIMSKDVISVATDDSPDKARRLLLDHDLRTLPVVDQDKRLVGTVGLRELVRNAGQPGLPLSEAATAHEDTLAISLLPMLTDGIKHCVVITDDLGSVKGIVSQTDLLAGLARSLAMHDPKRQPLMHGQGI